MKIPEHYQHPIWTPFEISDEGKKRELIKQILRGEIHRDQFPDIWPPEALRIVVTWPEDTV